MKILMAITLILLGTIWTFYATFNATMMRTRAMSDAGQMEADLHRWAADKVSTSDLAEIFPEGTSLRFGGESNSRNFRTMIEEIAISSAPSVWPGLAAVLVGLVGAIAPPHAKKTKKAEQASDGDA